MYNVGPTLGADVGPSLCTCYSYVLCLLVMNTSQITRNVLSASVGPTLIHRLRHWPNMNYHRPSIPCLLVLVKKKLCFVEERKYHIFFILPLYTLTYHFAGLSWSTYIFHQFRQQTFFCPHFQQTFLCFCGDKLLFHISSIS